MHTTVLTMRVRRTILLWLGVLVGLILGLLIEATAVPEVALGSELVDLRQLSVTGRSFFTGGRDPLITSNGIENRTLGQDLNLEVDTDVLTYLYWDSIVHSSTDRVLNPDSTTSNGQFRMIGLEFGFGVDLRRFDLGLPVRFGYYHYSQHELDGISPWAYPVRDALELKLYLFERRGGG